MKKLLLSLFIFSAFTSQAQIFQNQAAYGFQYKRLKIDSTLHIPTFCGIPPVQNAVKNAAVAFDSCNNRVYVFNPKSKAWGLINAGIDSIFFSSSSTVDTIKYRSNGAEYVAGLIDRKDGLVTPGTVTWNSGLTFDVTAAVYYIDGKRYTSASGSITLNPAGSLDRIDLIALDTLGHIIKVTGVQSVNPAVPQLDPSLGIILTQVSVKANATTPDGVSSQVVYDENTEWTTSSALATADFNNLTNPFHLSKAIYVTSGTSGGHLGFTNSTSLNTTNFNTLKLYINLQATVKKIYNLSVQFFNAGSAVSNEVILSSSTGLDKTRLNTYQNISIPLSDFNFTSSTFDQIRVNFMSSFNAFYLDYIQLQGGIINVNFNPNTVTDIFKSNGSLYKTINGNTSVITSLTDSLGYHTTTQLSDTTVRVNRSNNTGTVWVFEGGGGITQQQLNDTAQAIRKDFPVLSSEVPHLVQIISDSAAMFISNTLNWYFIIDAPYDYHLLYIQLPSVGISGGKLKNGDYLEFVFNKNFDVVNFNSNNKAIPVNMKIKAGDYVKFVYYAADSTWYGGGSGNAALTSQPSVTTGTAAPTSIPGKAGDIYIDTVAKKLYFASGNTSSADWIIAN